MTRTLSAEAYAHSLKLAREAKRRVTGKCQHCGTRTHYHGHGHRVSDCCVQCASVISGKRRRGTGKQGGALLEFLRGGEQTRAQIRIALNITENHCSVLLDRLLKYELVERPRRGIYRLPK